MAVFFDSVPTTQSRLLTFRCPNYKESDADKQHLITIAWKSKEGKVLLLLENACYRGKPLALTPNAIEGYQGENFPEGILYSTCTCLPKKEGKLCYIATEITGVPQVKRAPARDGALKATKKISNDIKATTSLLIQLYDGIEDMAEAHNKSNTIFLQMSQDIQSRLSRLESSLDSLHKVSAVLGKKMEELLQKFEGPKESQPPSPVAEPLPDRVEEVAARPDATDVPAEQAHPAVAEPLPQQDVPPETRDQSPPQVPAPEAEEETPAAVLAQSQEYLEKLRKFAEVAQLQAVSSQEVEELEDFDVFMESSAILQVDETAEGGVEPEVDKALKEGEGAEKAGPMTGVTQILEAAYLRAALAQFPELAAETQAGAQEPPPPKKNEEPQDASGQPKNDPSGDIPGRAPGSDQ